MNALWLAGAVAQDVELAIGRFQARKSLRPRGLLAGEIDGLAVATQSSAPSR